MLQLGYDVVLVDTAGRMQNKEPLMRALAELISDNSPDLTLFVGEALVGNDGIDQLSMFNMALANYSPPGDTPLQSPSHTQTSACTCSAPPPSLSPCPHRPAAPD